MVRKSFNSLRSFIFDKAITFTIFQMLRTIFPVKQAVYNTYNKRNYIGEENFNQINAYIIWPSRTSFIPA